MPDLLVTAVPLLTAEQVAARCAADPTLTPEKVEKAPAVAWETLTEATTPFPCPGHLVRVETSGLFVIDVDVEPPAPGEPRDLGRLLDALGACYPVLLEQPTLMSQTAGGGIHFWYQVTDPQQAVRRIKLVRPAPKALADLGVKSIDWLGTGLAVSPGTVLSATGRQYRGGKLAVMAAPRHLTPAKFGGRRGVARGAGETPDLVLPETAPALDALPPCLRAIVTALVSKEDNTTTDHVPRVHLAVSLFNLGWARADVEAIFAQAADYRPSTTTQQLDWAQQAVGSTAGYKPYRCALVAPYLPPNTCQGCGRPYVLADYFTSTAPVPPAPADSDGARTLIEFFQQVDEIESNLPSVIAAAQVATADQGHTKTSLTSAYRAWKKRERARAREANADQGPDLPDALPSPHGEDAAPPEGADRAEVSRLIREAQATQDSFLWDWLWDPLTERWMWHDGEACYWKPREADYLHRDLIRLAQVLDPPLDVSVSILNETVTLLARTCIWNPPLTPKGTNCANGVLEFTTGKPVLRDYERVDYFTYRLPTAFLPAQADDETPLYDNWSDTYPVGMSLIEAYVRNILWGRHEPLMLVIMGEKHTGKSELAALYSQMLGQDAVASLDPQPLGEDQFALSELVGKHINIVPELNRTALCSTSIKYLKALVDPEARISVNIKGVQRKTVNFAPFWTIWAGNAFPLAQKGENLSPLFRRIMPVEMSAPMPHTAGFHRDIVKELDIIFTQLVLLGPAPLLDCRDQGKHKQVCREFVQKWSDPVHRALSANVVPSPGDELEVKAVIESVGQWLANHDEEVDIGEKWVTRTLKRWPWLSSVREVQEKGVKKQFYINVAWKPRDILGFPPTPGPDPGPEEPEPEPVPATPGARDVGKVKNWCPQCRERWGNTKKPGECPKCGQELAWR